ncbi:MAG: SH3 domain-containing protein [Oscillospiraceae bacterium]|nr:SH3 domain-containing protein [Oscillospiraceae bacterium]
MSKRKSKLLRRSIRTAVAAASLAALMAVSVTASAASGVVTDGPLRMRSGPGTSYEILNSLSTGTSAEVLDAANGWFKISYGGQTGYVSGDFMTLSDPLNGVVSADVLNVRSGPSTDYARIAKLVAGNRLSVTGSSGTWYQVSLQGQTGYVASEYVTVQQTKTGYVSADVLNVRSQPDLNGERFAQLNYGTQVEILGEVSGWYQISLQGRTGYVSTSYVSTTPLGGGSASGTAPVPPPAANASAAQQVVAIAKSYLGTPYVYGGMSPSGFDCSGFTAYVYKQIGVNLIHGASSQMTASNGYSVSRDQLQPGDLVFFRAAGSSYPATHVGIYIGDNCFIHASSSGGRIVITDLSVDHYSMIYAGAKRVI